MLVTRPFETGRTTWSYSKLEAAFHNNLSPRMSESDPIHAQRDWRGTFSNFPNSGDNGAIQTSFTNNSVSRKAHEQQQPQTRPVLEHRHSVGLLRQEPQPQPATERPDSAPPLFESAPLDNNNNNASNESLTSPTSAALSLVPTSLSFISSAPTQQNALARTAEVKLQGDFDEEDDALDDDDDMLDAEGDDGATAQTSEQRRAERRKMKRFRLTHQQTRFLMSEFAKQAHPDAGHRERLSREIPGLSPRQVQVWFQNRRAKIKRLTADDRERMMKSRAVPDDFDNVQALHSPYGAVHGLNTPMLSPLDFASTYPNQSIRPLMVDPLRRSENEDHLSPTGLSPSFNNVGFAPTSDMLSPVSMNTSERFYPNHLNSPMSAGPRSANPFDRQSSYSSIAHSRQQVRPIQPLYLRDPMSRSRSDSLQSPLRSSMSWKGETLDYNSYQTGQSSPALSGRQQSVYQPDQMINKSVNAQQFDGSSSSYSNPNLQSSPTQLAYSTSAHGPSSLLQQSSPSAMSRLRTTSLAFPSVPDPRAQYQTIQNQNQTSNNTRPRSTSYASAFSSTGFSSAPLTAPAEFALPRTPGDVGNTNRDFHIPQLSAPMNPPQDFSNAYAESARSQQQHQNEANFEGQGSNYRELGVQGQVRLSPQQRQQQVGNVDDGSYIRQGQYMGLKRKRSFDNAPVFESP